MGGSGSKTAHFDALVEKIPSQAKKIVAVTGCTSGTGLVAALTIVSKGGHVVMLNRPSDRAKAAFETVKARATEAKQGGEATHIDCDLMDFDGVRAASDQVASEFKDGGIDVLINNAGVMALPDKATKDGHDVQMQTNHLSHFLLTARLYPLLCKAAERSGEARIVNHSSIARVGGKLEEEYLGKNGGKLGGDSSYKFMGSPQWKRYQQTKLANCVFTYAFVDKCPNPAIKCLVGHPGVAKTQLATTTGTSNSGVMRMLSWGKFGQSEEDGTCGILSGAFLTSAKTGEFYGPGPNGQSGAAVLIEPEEKCTNQEAKDMLWKSSVDAVGQDFKF